MDIGLYGICAWIIHLSKDAHLLPLCAVAIVRTCTRGIIDSEAIEKSTVEEIRAALGLNNPIPPWRLRDVLMFGSMESSSLDRFDDRRRDYRGHSPLASPRLFCSREESTPNEALVGAWACTFAI